MHNLTQNMAPKFNTLYARCKHLWNTPCWFHGVRNLSINDVPWIVTKHSHAIQWSNSSRLYSRERRRQSDPRHRASSDYGACSIIDDAVQGACPIHKHFKCIKSSYWALKRDLMVVCDSTGLRQSINPCCDSVCECESDSQRQRKLEERGPVLFVLIPPLSPKRSIISSRNKELSIIRFVRSPTQVCGLVMLKASHILRRVGGADCAFTCVQWWQPWWYSYQ